MTNRIIAAIIASGAFGAAIIANASTAQALVLF